MVAAAILPTCIHQGKLYFLFGKECEYETSAPGYSDFGGGLEKGETIINTASREGYEELSGFLGSAKEIRQQLKRRSMRISVTDYHTYIYPVSYDPQLVIYFNNHQTLVHQKLSKKTIVDSRIFEKQSIRWVCVDDLLSFKSKVRSFYKANIDAIYNQRHQIKQFTMNFFKKDKTKQRKQTKRRKTRRLLN